ncbi:MAG TPA: glycosyltransferase family A protein [Tepidiformaceae bacterium]|nr:glycosyltransferase family A protein [Tepidiformaceae bacterium]
MPTESAHQPAISVVIPTRDRPAFVRDALAALQAQTLTAFEVLVMDQSGDEATRELTEAFGDARFRYRRMPRPGGCPARNYGAALATAPLVAFLDDDSEPRANWLANIVGHFETDPALAFVFGNLRAPAFDPALGEIPECLAGDLVRPGDSVRALMRHCSGGCMAARKGLLRRIGGFDELLGPANPAVRANDVSIAYKVYRSGAKWLAADDVEVMHTHGFRPHTGMDVIHASSMHGSGVFWGRRVRQGDWRAALHFAVAEAGLLRRPLGHLIRGGKPRGVKPAWRHLKGFLDGLRLPAEVGHITGAVLRRMEATALLDPPAAAPGTPIPPAPATAR